MMVPAVVRRFRPFGFEGGVLSAPYALGDLAHGLREHRRPAAKGLGPGQGPVESGFGQRMLRAEEIQGSLPVAVRQPVEQGGLVGRVDHAGFSPTQPSSTRSAAALCYSSLNF
jgi:hypothetical protein